VSSWIDIVQHRGLDPAVPAIPIDVYRVTVAAACLFKFGLGHIRHAAGYFDEGSYVRYAHQRRGYGIPLNRASYRGLYTAKFVAALCFFLGVVPHLAGVVLAGWLFLELGFDHKYHTTFLALAVGLLTLDPGLGRTLNPSTVMYGVSHGWSAAFDRATSVHAGYWIQLLIVLLVTQMYWSSAVWKLRSPAFRRGVVLHQMARYLYFEHPRWPYREMWYPGVLARAISEERVTPAWWAVPAVTTIALELALPVLLVLSPWPTAFMVGAVMHLGFNWLLPARLVPFSMATVGAYVLFVDPSRIATAIDGLARAL